MFTIRQIPKKTKEKHTQFDSTKRVNYFATAHESMVNKLKSSIEKSDILSLEGC